MTMAYVLPLTLFPFALIFAAFSDLFTMRISNKVSLALVIGFFFAAFLKGLAWPVVAWHFGAALLMLLFTLIAFAQGHMGGADAKLAPAIVLWLGPNLMASFVLFAALFGGVLAVSLLYLRGLPLSETFLRFAFMRRLYSQTTDIPYGINLALAGLVVILESFWLK